MTIAEKIKKIMSEILGKEIADDCQQQNEDDWDSFAQLDIITKLEDEFGVSFSPDEIGGMTTLPEIIKIVETKTDK
ncbi:MAG: acyl carrier protein [Candidatus Saccharibacteria bacterium]|nr:acyl carrier protein [Candidatus Saccharibacteria bacterium]